MFETCRADGPRRRLDGWSDSNPILLHGHSVKAFEDLMRVLHAKPDEVREKIEALSRQNALDDLVTLAEMSHKYLFVSTTKLIAGLLQRYVRNFNDRLKTISTDLLQRALLVAIDLRDEFLQSKFSRIYATRVLDKTIPAEAALEFGKTHSLRTVQGAAHYVLLFSIENAPLQREFALGPAKFGPQKNGLDHRLKQRLLHGYWSLMRCSQHLAGAPPFSLEKCKALNVTHWHDTYVCVAQCRPTPSDPLAMLQQARTLLREFFDDNNVEADRQALVLSELDRVIQHFHDTLMDHFDF